MSRYYRNLHEFVEALDAAGELLRVRAPVSSHLEITEVTDIMSKAPGGGKALLFENVEGSEFPVLTNQFGSERRMAMALGAESIEGIADRVRELLEIAPPVSMTEKMAMIPKALEVSRFLPRKVRGGACQEVVMEAEEVDLSRLPVLHCWPEDGGRFITLPLVFTKGLSDGRRNVGMYRMQVFDANTTGMHWHIHKDGRHHFNEYVREGKRMEVAVAVGTDPATTYAATAPMPRGMDEMLLAGFIRRRPVEMVRCRTVDIEVPAEAEFVLEGYVIPGETRLEGPFGDHTGYYSLADQYPVFHVTAVTHRKDAIYSATVVGRPPMEDCYLAKTTERLFLPPLRMLMPEIVDHWMPWEGVFHNIVVVAIQKEYPHQARKVMSGLWGSSQMSFAKMIVVIDRPELLRSPDLLDHLLRTIDLSSDVLISEGVLDVLDHSSPSPLYGGKLGIDATRRMEGEPDRSPSRFAPMHDVAIGKIVAGLDGIIGARVVGPSSNIPVILLNVSKEGIGSKELIGRLLSSELRAMGVMIMFDRDIDLADDSLVLWKAFNNVDPRADIVLGEGIVVDATRKGPGDGFTRDWPGDIVMDDDVRQRIRSRAKELGIEQFL